MLIFHVIVIFFSLLCIPLSWCENASIAPTYNNNFGPQIEFQPQIVFQPQIEFQPQINITYSFKIGDITLQCIQKIKDATRDNYNLLKNNLKTLAWQYRYHLVGGTITSAYLMTTALLLIDYYHHLHANTLWAHWKQECSFEDL